MKTAKQFSRRTLFTLLALLVLTVSALADTGPKPQLTVRLENPPEEPYYLDLLAEGTYDPAAGGYNGLEWSYSYEELQQLDQDLLNTLLAQIPMGWHACTAQGGSFAPMRGDLVGEDAGDHLRLHSFSYVGVPETYRVLLVTQSGDCWITDAYTRHALQSSITLNWADRTASAPSAWLGRLTQFVCTLLPTLLVEGVLLWLFGYRSRKSWLSFLLVNLLTQGGFALYLTVTVLYHGVSGWSLLFYIPIEVIITVAELLLYRVLLTEKSRSRAAAYAIIANICSASVGLLLIDPLWRWIISFS